MQPDTEAVNGLCKVQIVQEGIFGRSIVNWAKEHSGLALIASTTA